MLTWDDFRRFIDARDARYWSSIRGVPEEDIRHCEELCGITLPKMYTSFLVLMGADAGAFRPFGASQVCDFYELVDALPPVNYPGDRYFKVSFENNPSVDVCQDVFIDLAKADGNDAPLVLFEEAGKFFQEDVIPLGFTLTEQFARRIFDHFELARHPARSVLRFYPDEPEELDREQRRALEFLAKMGFAPSWRPLPRVGCFSQNQLSILLQRTAETQGLIFKVAGADAAEVAIAAELICDAFPEAIMSER